MANICFNEVVIVGKKEVLINETMKAFERLEIFREYDGIPINLFFDLYEIENYNNGYVQTYEYDEDKSCLYIYFTSRWIPIYEPFKKLIEKYNINNESNFNFYILAEESGDLIFVNTDTSGIYFDTRYIIDSNLPCFEEEGEHYYKNITDFVNDYEKIKPRMGFENIKKNHQYDLEDYCEKNNLDLDEYYLNVAEYEKEWSE